MSMHLHHRPKWSLARSNESRAAAGRAASRSEILVRVALPIALLWMTVAVASWRAFAPYSAWVFFALVVVAMMAEAHNAALLLIALMYVPLDALRLQRPYMVTFAIVAAWAFAGASRQRVTWALKRPGVIATAVFALVNVVSLAHAPDVAGGWSYVSFTLQAAAFLVVVQVGVQDEQSARVSLRALALCAFGGALLGILHGMFRSHMELTTELAQGKYMWRMGVDDWAERMVWAGAEPNYWAAQLLFPLGSALGILGAERSWRGRAFWAVVSAGILGGILGTFSRSAAIVAAMMGAVLLVLRGRKGLTIAVLWTLVTVVLVGHIPFLRDRLLSIPEEIGTTGGNRFWLWQRAWERAVDSAFIGGGAGSFLHDVGLVAHNTYLQVLADLGAAGLLILGTALGIGVRYWWRLRKIAMRVRDKQMRWLCEGCLAGYLGVIAFSATISAHNPMHLWTPIAIGAALWHPLRRAVAHSSRGDLSGGRFTPPSGHVRIGVGIIGHAPPARFEHEGEA
jgi:hypothetical protein